MDAVVCDPPYELGFMGKSWDAAGIAFDPALWREVLRVIKPGGYLLAFGGTRTYHRMTVAIEDAGFEVRDCIGWTYGSGFPKSLDLSKAIDKAAGAEREVVGRSVYGDGHIQNSTATIGFGGCDPSADRRLITAPTTDDAKRWAGWGTALKPAWEPIVVARAPFPGTVAANVLRHGTGAMNIDGCRVAGAAGDEVSLHGRKATDNGWDARWSNAQTARQTEGQALGRWPANLLLSHGADCREVGTRQAKATSGIRPKDTGTVYGKTHKSGSMAGEKGVVLGPTYADENGEETVAVWECAPGCPVAALDAQSGDRAGMRRATLRRGATTGTSVGGHGIYGERPPHEVEAGYGDTGGASRFFNQLPIAAEDFVPFAYVAKASRSEREAGCDALPARTGAEAVDRAEGSAGLTPRAGAGRSADKVRNHHPTVKPVSVMRWCVRLVTPPGGVVLDPFMGSGTTGIAAVREGVRFVGIEREAEYLAIAEARIGHAVGGGFAKTEPPTPVRTTPSTAFALSTGKEAATTYGRHKEATVFVKSIVSNAKKGANAELGARTLIIGPNGSGKSSIVNAVELALTGRASDVVGRAEVAKGIDLLALAPADDDALWAKAVLSDGREVAWRCERNAKTGGAREAVHALPSDLTVEFPVRAVRSALEGKAETVRAWLIGRIGSAVTEESVRTLIPEDLRAVYAEVCRPLFGTPVQVLLDAREATARTLRTLSSEAKGAEKLADSLGSGLAVEPTEADIEAARVRVREAVVAQATPTPAPVDPEPLRVAAVRAVTLYSDLSAEVARISEAVGASAPVNEEVARLRDALTRVLTYHAVQRLDACLVCGGAAGHAHGAMLTRAEGMTDAARRDVETLDLRAKLARTEKLAEAAQVEAQRAVAAYQAAAAAFTANSATGAHGSEDRTAMLRAAEATLRELEQARGAWANVRAAKAQARDASARQRLYSDLRDEIEGAIKLLLDRSRVAFVKKVQSYLPESDAFDLVLDADGKEVCRFGFVRDGVLHTALSGAEWARLTLALAAATTDDRSLAVLTPEDRAFDADTLTAVMRGLSSAPGQVLLCSPVAPAGRTPKGWTVIDLSGEKPAKAKKPAKAAVAEEASEDDAFDAVGEAK